MTKSLTAYEILVLVNKIVATYHCKARSEGKWRVWAKFLRFWDLLCENQYNFNYNIIQMSINAVKMLDVVCFSFLAALTGNITMSSLCHYNHSKHLFILENYMLLSWTSSCVDPHSVSKKHSKSDDVVAL